MNLNHSYNLMCLKTIPVGNTSFNPENQMYNLFFKTKNLFTELFVIVWYCTVSVHSSNIIHLTADLPVCNTF